jgi:hypothetical protein
MLSFQDAPLQLSEKALEIGHLLFAHGMLSEQTLRAARLSHELKPEDFSLPLPWRIAAEGMEDFYGNSQTLYEAARDIEAALRIMARQLPQDTQITISVDDEILMQQSAHYLKQAPSEA